MSLDKQLGMCSRRYTMTFSSRSQTTKGEVDTWGKRSKLGGKDWLRNWVSQGLVGLEL